MTPALKKFAGWSLVLVWAFICGEILIRIFSSFTLIYDIEMLRYAKELKVKSPMANVSHQHRTGVAARLMNVEIALNSLGHRSAELAVPKPENEKRIHFLGSSILLAWGVDQDKGFAEVAVDYLNANNAASPERKYVAINAGIGNYNTFYEVALFERQIDQTKPDMIILQYHINDAEPNSAGSDSVILKHSEFAAFLYLHLKSLAAVGGKSLDAHYRDLYTDQSPGWRNTMTAVKKLQGIAAKRDIPLAVVLVPDLHDLSPNGPYMPIYDLVIRELAKIGIPVINPLLELQMTFAGDVRNAWVYRDDPHPNVRTHGIIGKAIAEYLTVLDF